MPALDKKFPGLDLPENYLAIVSPCSTCSNQRSESQNGLPACPRRAAVAAAQELQANNFSSTVVDPLTLTGNEDNPYNQNSTGLINPVYSSTYNTIYVWVAAIKDNQGVYDSSGNQLCPNILATGFDTNYISCRLAPTTPQENEAEYFRHGAWKEWDNISVTEAPTNQIIPDPNNIGGTTPVMTGGTAKKINLNYMYNRQPVQIDHSVSGT